jgi:hypothetical protein
LSFPLPLPSTAPEAPFQTFPFPPASGPREGELRDGQSAGGVGRSGQGRFASMLQEAAERLSTRESSEPGADARLSPGAQAARSSQAGADRETEAPRQPASGRQGAAEGQPAAGARQSEEPQQATAGRPAESRSGPETRVGKAAAGVKKDGSAGLHRGEKKRETAGKRGAEAELRIGAKGASLLRGEGLLPLAHGAARVGQAAAAGVARRAAERAVALQGIISRGSRGVLPEGGALAAGGRLPGGRAGVPGLALSPAALPVSPLKGEGQARSASAARQAGAQARPRLTVIDLRGAASAPASPLASAALARLRENEAGRRDSSPQGRLEKEFALLLKASGAEKAPGGGERAAPPAAALRSFQQNNLPELVRQTGIILKEGGTGEIRLVLKPENLGSVRIRLELGESSLAGRIVVENSSVKELLEASMEQLKSALRHEGFQSASLEVAVSGDRAREGREQGEGPLVMDGMAVQGPRQLQEAVPAYLDFLTERALVNVFV